MRPKASFFCITCNSHPGCEFLIEVIVTLIEFDHVIHTHLACVVRHILDYLLQGVAPRFVVVHECRDVLMSGYPW